MNRLYGAALASFLLCINARAADGDIAENTTVVAAAFVSVDPQGTFLLSANPFGGLPSCLEFSLFAPTLTQPGAIIGLQRVGAFRPAPGSSDNRTGLLGAFVGLVQNAWKLLNPGPLSTVQTNAGPNCSPESGLINASEDFSITGTEQFVQIPNSASMICFAPNECSPFNNSDPNNNFGVIVRARAVTQRYVLMKQIYSQSDVEEENSSSVEMVPSVEKCGQLSKFSEERKLKLACIDRLSGTPTTGCSIDISLQLGTNSGGHSHIENRPFGKLLLNNQPFELNAIPIPIEGFAFNYQSPDVSGDVIMNFTGAGPDGSTLATTPTEFIVRTADDFEEINVSGLNFDIVSHPEGNYGTRKMNDYVASIIRTYKEEAENDGRVPVELIPDLESEGASLPLGGLFDIGRNWKQPHCGHRDGKTLDLSMSSFINSDFKIVLKKALRNAIIEAGFEFWGPESPNNPSANHWHIRHK